MSIKFKLIFFLDDVIESLQYLNYIMQNISDFNNKMENIEQLKQSSKKFISEQYKINIDEINKNEIELKCQKMNGLTNNVFLTQLIDKRNNVCLHEFIYRQFGQIGDLLDRKLEALVTKTLSGPGYSPIIFESDNSTYRIEEYISDADNLSKENIFNDNLLNQIQNILIQYTLISNVHTFNIKDGSINLTCEDQIYKPQTGRITQNIYTMCTNTMLNKAVQNLKLFKDKLKEDQEMNGNDINDSLFYVKLEAIEDTVKNYKELFADVFPEEGLFVLNHNDLHRLNVLHKYNDEIMILDHEYAALNLIGNDIVNYLIESAFDYTPKEFPFSEFNIEAINYNHFYAVFLEFIKKFEIKYEKGLITEDIKQKFNVLKSYSYFLRVFCIVNYFWFLYGVIYMDLEKYKKKSKFDYMGHSFQRIKILETAKKEFLKSKD